jgi:hypothetical protein
VIEYALILITVFVVLAIAAWRAMRDLWRVLPEDEDEHAEIARPVGLPHNRKSVK